jgi:hypothetical protein
MKVGEYVGNILFCAIKPIEDKFWHTVDLAIKEEIRHKCFDITQNVVEEVLENIFFDIRRKIREGL